MPSTRWRILLLPGRGAYINFPPARDIICFASRGKIMRAELDSIVTEIKQSLELLRRRL